MGHPQDATELKTDNTTYDGIANKTVQQKRSKAMDMRYYWIQNCIEQGQFDVSWDPRDTNLGDYFTKHHSPSHHKRIRPFYLHSQADPMILHNTKHPVLRGCVNLCTTSQTDNAHVPSLCPHPYDYTGVPTQAIVPTIPPPFPAQGKATRGARLCSKVTVQQHHATARYASIRCQTAKHRNL
jgi:hypothetical protein